MVGETGLFMSLLNILVSCETQILCSELTWGFSSRNLKYNQVHVENARFKMSYFQFVYIRTFVIFYFTPGRISAIVSQSRICLQSSGFNSIVSIGLVVSEVKHSLLTKKKYFCSLNLLFFVEKNKQFILLSSLPPRFLPLISVHL